MPYDIVETINEYGVRVLTPVARMVSATSGSLLTIDPDRARVIRECGAGPLLERITRKP